MLTRRPSLHPRRERLGKTKGGFYTKAIARSAMRLFWISAMPPHSIAPLASGQANISRSAFTVTSIPIFRLSIRDDRSSSEADGFSIAGSLSTLESTGPLAAAIDARPAKRFRLGSGGRGPATASKENEIWRAKRKSQKRKPKQVKSPGAR